MSVSIQFRLPQTTTILTPLFGIPKGTFGRGIYAPSAIILHELDLTLESYDSQVIHPEYLLYRNKAQPIHPSLHFAVGYEGEVHQYVNVADVAWGCFDYYMSHFPDPFPEGSWGFLSTYPGITPDKYVIHIGAASGILGEHTPMSAASLKQHARLIAYYCHLYSIPCDIAHVVTHETVDLQFEGVCVSDETYPYAEILAAAQAIIAHGGEDDLVFSHRHDLETLFGEFIVDKSIISSAAYVSND